MDINEEIKNLQEAFEILVEGRKEGESTEDFKHRLHGELVRSIDKKAGKAKEELLAGKGSYEKYKKEHDKLGKLDDIEPVANAYVKVEKANESSYIMTQILDLTEAYVNLLEAKDARGGAQKEVNKITRTKKDKNGEPIEVVSVADELFPYKGTAKEQYNQKILAKINDMIEGTATLDDLIQLVRSKKPAVNVKESLQETLDKMMAVTEEIINEKNANKAKRKAYEINQAERKQGELEYDPFYRKDARSVKYANQNTIRELKKIKPTNYTQGQALKSAQLSLAQQTRDTLGREDHPENPYKKPFVWAGGYKNLYGNLNQKAFERKGYGNLKIRKDSNSPVKDLVKTSIEQEKKIKPNLPKPVKESLQETLNQMMAITEEIILERNKENRAKKEKWELKTNHITKKEKKAVQDYAKEQGDEAKYHQRAADDYDNIYSRQRAVAPNGMRNPVADYFNGKYQEMLRNKGRNEQNIADEVEPLTKKLKNREHKFHDMVRGFHDLNLNH